MKLYTLEEWLNWITTLHSSQIDLGLDRIKPVAMKLGVLETRCPTIIVGGTNGKGSTVATLEAVYMAANYRVGCFTSPYLLCFNEQIRVNGVFTSDEALCDAFSRVNAARGEVTLTPFEFHTLAALYVLNANHLDVMILEVGLGGRLDAVNIIDATVSIITTIAMDHEAYLGNTREAIGFEKAGILRPNQMAVCGELDPPSTLLEVEANLVRQGIDFFYARHAADWTWQSKQPPCLLEGLPLSPFALQNISSALMGITLLQTRLPVTDEQIKSGISQIKLRGRIEVIPGAVTVILDVAHNPASVARLSDYLQETPCSGKTYAVFAMLADKDIVGSLRLIAKEVDEWFLAPLPVERGASLVQLREAFVLAGVMELLVESGSVVEALALARGRAVMGDRIVVFGSFYTVSAVMLFP